MGVFFYNFFNSKFLFYLFFKYYSGIRKMGVLKKIYFCFKNISSSMSLTKFPEEYSIIWLEHESPDPYFWLILTHKQISKLNKDTMIKISYI